ncbi:holin [Clavibacter capsici]|uniref:holin n=1 Tax=Clavibacter capsici TaxID=1874630 RepID=UPI0014281AFD|nr:holin [Clavibacter capsici]QIS38600.1 holin [Clavibacter capsici]
MFTVPFWKAAGERAIKTFAQVLLAAIVVGQTGFLDLDWAGVGSVAGVAALASVLTSIVSDKVGSNGPSLAGEELPAEGRHL